MKEDTRQAISTIIGIHIIALWFILLAWGAQKLAVLF